MCGTPCSSRSTSTSLDRISRVVLPPWSGSGRRTRTAAKATPATRTTMSTAAMMISSRCRRLEPGTLPRVAATGDPAAGARRAGRRAAGVHGSGRRMARPQARLAAAWWPAGTTYGRPMSRSPLPSRRRSVRVRRLLWRWRYLLLAVSVLVATGVVLGELRPPEPVTTDVVVLARDVPAGSELAAGDLTLARLPELALVEAARTPAEVLGRRLAVGLPA